MVSGIEYNEIQLKTEAYVKNFKNGNFDVAKIKAEIDEQWGRRRKPPKNTYMGEKDCFLYF